MSFVVIFFSFQFFFLSFVLLIIKRFFFLHLLVPVWYHFSFTLLYFLCGFFFIFRVIFVIRFRCFSNVKSCRAFVHWLAMFLWILLLFSSFFFYFLFFMPFGCNSLVDLFWSRSALLFFFVVVIGSFLLLQYLSMCHLISFSCSISQ